MADYFDNLAPGPERERAVGNYTYNELVLRAPMPSLGSKLLRLLNFTDRVFGEMTSGSIALWFTRFFHHTGFGELRLPRSYIILHNDIFHLPSGVKTRKLAAGHYILNGRDHSVGIMACRRGAFEAELQADALARLGVNTIVFIGTCLRLTSDEDQPLIVIPSEYLSESGYQTAAGPLATDAELSTSLQRRLTMQGVESASGQVYIAHRFVLDESPELLSTLTKQGTTAIEMEGIGFGAAMKRHGGAFAALLIGLDRYCPDGKMTPLNSDIGSYITAARTARTLARAAFTALGNRRSNVLA